MTREQLSADDISSVTAHVHQGAIDVLGPVVNPVSVHQSKFSMGTVLGLIAVHGLADLDAFERYALKDERVIAFRDRVHMERDDEVDTLYPQHWVGKVSVRTSDRRHLTARVDEPKGDPGNTLTKDELEAKALRLAAFANGATEAEMRVSIDRIWKLHTIADAGSILPGR